MEEIDQERLHQLAARGLYPGAERSEVLDHRGEVVAEQYREQIPPPFVDSDYSGIRRRDRRKAARQSGVRL